jgi:CRISPR-associated exonuclease Cas4
VSPDTAAPDTAGSDSDDGAPRDAADPGADDAAPSDARGAEPADRVAFSDLRTAAYCLRQLHYRRRDDRGTPPAVAAVRDLAFRYDELRDADDATLRDLPVERSPAAYREALAATAASRDDWGALVDPPARDVLLTGKDCRGVAHKVLADPPRPSLVAAGEPPERGVWEPQRVHAVAAAKALAWERERAVETALVEYPAYGAVRTVRLTTRNRAAYRRTLRSVRSLDGVPPRISDRAKCGPCEYSDTCGVRTRTLSSLLGL